MAVTDFTKLVPGFDFLQSLVKGAGGAVPGLGQWIAPTLDAEEVDKRIQELRTVQFWLEQNSRLLGATIQALEVQRMTLATLNTMNLPLADLRDSFKLDPSRFITPGTAAATRAEPEPEPEAEPEATAPAVPAKAAASASRTPRSAGAARRPRQSTTRQTDAAAPTPASAVDPLQWWGALTRQFTELATQAVKDTPVEAAAQAASQLAGVALKTATEPVRQAARGVARATARSGSSERGTGGTSGTRGTRGKSGTRTRAAR